VSSIRAICTVSALAMLVVAALPAIDTWVASAADVAGHRFDAASQDCSARYAALLDLAELARRDGQSADVIVRGLSGQGGAMSACLPAGHAIHGGANLIHAAR